MAASWLTVRLAYVVVVLWLIELHDVEVPIWPALQGAPGWSWRGYPSLRSAYMAVWSDPA